MKDPVVVVPCYNEERRLDAELVLALAEAPGPRVLLVDDGSKDGTWEVLERVRARAPDRVSTLRLEKNGGKAEAVRRGLRAALEGGADVVGYCDADFATPPDEMRRVLRRLEDPAVIMSMGSRVALLGRHVERRPARHYLGRIFATTASAMLGLRVYDTQCGAKALRGSTAVRAALDEPFLSRWAFDVELIGRLLAGSERADPVPPSAFVEVPLRVWRDVGGSKLGGGAMVKVLGDLVLIQGDMARRRRGRARR